VTKTGEDADALWAASIAKAAKKAMKTVPVAIEIIRQMEA
jgi:hypothetical protein